jgi:hypothetical protein
VALLFCPFSVPRSITLLLTSHVTLITPGILPSDSAVSVVNVQATLLNFEDVAWTVDEESVTE